MAGWRLAGLAALALAAAPPDNALAQGADAAALAAQQRAMQALAWMDGNWRGPATVQTPQGEAHVTQTERVGTFLGGTLRLVEGKAFQADGTVGFHAFGVISYDHDARSYWLTSHAQGRTGRFALALREQGFSWEVPIPGATLRYDARLEAGTWIETGDHVVAGQPPRRIFEMRLARIGDTSWPEAGSVGKD